MVSPVSPNPYPNPKGYIYINIQLLKIKHDVPTFHCEIREQQVQAYTAQLGERRHRLIEDESVNNI